jgi:hypothetical protein
VAPARTLLKPETRARRRHIVVDGCNVAFEVTIIEFDTFTEESLVKAMQILLKTVGLPKIVPAS